MNLFDTGEIANILPYEGTVLYYGKIFKHEEAKRYLDVLLHNIEWKNDEAIIFGKHFITPRKVALYGDSDYVYTYSNTKKQALRWTPELLELKKIAEERSNTAFNSCLLNLYHNGNEGMAWHSDDEKVLGNNNTIASLSFGAERKFAFKNKKTGETTSLILENGSLLVMKDETQANWLHRLPPATKIKTPRVNLTFRKFIG